MNMRSLIAGFVLATMTGLVSAPPVIAAAPATYYVRPDGGTAAQCSGLFDAPYITPSPVSGKPGVPRADKACAWVSPMIALPATYYGQAHNPPARIAAGDTLIVAPADYTIGWRTTNPIPGAEACNSGDPDSCFMQAPPDGVHILGKSTTKLARFFGIAGVWTGLNLNGTNNVEVANLEITQKDRCKKGSQIAGFACAPVGQGNWMQNGIVMVGADHAYIHNVNVHDLANEGIKGGRNDFFTLMGITVAYNAEAGIDWDCTNGDHSQACDNTGILTLENSTVEGNGGIRTAQGLVYFDQDHGGYGDGFGTWHTGGHWRIINNRFIRNGSDNIDCLYCDGTNGTGHPSTEPAVVDIIGNYSEGAAGNQIKSAGEVLNIFRNVAIGDCGPDTWALSPKNNATTGSFVGKYHMDLDATCRAAGTVFSIAVDHAAQIKVYNNTAYCQAGGCFSDTTENGTDSSGAVEDFRNNIWFGQAVDWQQFATGGGVNAVPGTFHYNTVPVPAETHKQDIYYAVKGNQCPTGALCVNPKLTGPSVVKADARPLPGSPAINAGDIDACTSAGMTISQASATLPKPHCNIGAK